MFKNPIQSLVITAIIAGTLGFPRVAAAQTDTINFKNNKLRTAYLKPGLKQYLVTVQTPGKHKTLNLSYWVRQIKASTRNREKVFVTTQHWYSTDTLSYRTIYSVNKQSDFAPLYHTETLRNRTRAYNWSYKKITGADSVAHNEAQAFTLDLTEPAFNWNLDIETFEMLPLAAGKTFAINLYDAGFGKPGYVQYKVTGSEVITLLDNSKTDCWILLTSGQAPNGTTYTQTFWISKKWHELLKEEGNFNGVFRTKIKLPGTMPDVVARFKQP